MSDLSVPRQLAKLDTVRLAGYVSNLRFYGGNQWPASRKRVRRLVLNYARVVVEKVTSYVMSGAHLEVVAAAGSGSEAEAAALEAEGALALVAAQNGLERLDYETEIDTAVLGDGAYKVRWDDVVKGVVVTAPDVQGLFAWWDPRDRRRLVRVAERYMVSPEWAAEYGVTVAKPVAAVEDWTEKTSDLWVGEHLVEAKANPCGFVPYTVFPNLPVPKSGWGVSDVSTVREVAVELNREFTAVSRIMELSGDPIAVLENVEESSDIAVEPGAVWELPEKAKAYLLDLLAGGGVSVHLEYLDRLYRALHDLAESPRTAFGDNARSLSGVALGIELKPLEQLVVRKRLVRGDALVRRGGMILALLDEFTGTSHKSSGVVSVSWGGVMPEDKPQDAGREAALWQAGLTSATGAMARLGEQDPHGEWVRMLAQMAEVAAVVGRAPAGAKV
jgi:hypothetical protein